MKVLKVLVACEFSGTVRDAFAAFGHDAWSCDLLPSLLPGKHLQCDVREVLSNGWDILLAFPDCTFLTNSAAWAYKAPDFARYPGVGYHQRLNAGTLFGARRQHARDNAVSFVRALWTCGIERVAIENPIGILSTRFMKPEPPHGQVVQPYQFGDDASKGTCLWLKGLPLLVPTQFVPPRLVDGRPRWANQTDGGQNKLSPIR